MISRTPQEKIFLRYAVVFAAVYFFSINGLASLPNLSLSFLLKENVGLTPAQMAFFQALTLIAWIIKPLWGYLSDAVPVFGYRRKSYLILSSAAAGAAWLILCDVKQYTVGILLISYTLSSMAYAIQDVATDGLMIEVGKPLNKTGAFQSIQWAAVYTALILTALGGGWISDLARTGKIPYQAVFAMTAVFPLLTLILILRYIAEPKAENLGEAEKPHFKEILKSRELWLLAFFLFFWNFSPSVGAPFFYYAVDTLKFSGKFLGILQAAASASALIGSIVFARHVDRLPIRKFLIFAVVAGAGTLLFNYLYFIPSLVARPGILKAFSLLTVLPFGLLNIVIFLMLLNLSARVCPQYAGGTVFSILMSFFNLGQLGSNVAGGLLLPILGLKGLIAVSSICSLFTLLFLPYLNIPEPLTRLEESIKKALPFK